MIIVISFLTVLFCITNRKYIHSKIKILDRKICNMIGNNKLYHSIDGCDRLYCEIEGCDNNDNNNTDF